MKVEIVDNNKKKIDVRTIWIGLICMTLLEVVALLKGINGILLTVVIGIIAAAIGIAIPKEKFIK